MSTSDGASVVGEVALPHNERAVLRLIRPDDAQRLQELGARLSLETIRYRFFGLRRVLLPDEAAHLARVDYRDRAAVVAEHATLSGAEIIGVARYDRLPTQPDRAEFAILVEDRFQHTGVGRALVEALAVIARRNGITRLVGDALAENEPMRHFIQNVGFPLTSERRGAEIHFSWDITAPA